MLLQSFAVVALHESAEPRSPGIAAKGEEPEVIESKNEQTDDVPYARQRSHESLHGTVLPVRARENPLCLAHEQGQPGYLAGNGRHDLGC